MPSDYYVPRDPWFIRARLLKKGMFYPGEAPALSAQNSAVNLYAEQFNAGAALNGASGSKSNSQPNSANPTRPSSAVGDQAAGQDSFTGPGQAPNRSGSQSTMGQKEPNPDVGVWVFVDIQLYMLESNTYMVDFKCDGYQNVMFVEEGSGHGSHTNNSSAVNSPASSRPTSGFGQLRPGDAMNGMQHDEDHHSAKSADNRKGEWRPVSRRIRNKEKEITSPYPYLDVASDLIAQLAASS